MKMPASGRRNNNQGWVHRNCIDLSNNQRKSATREPTIRETGMTKRVQRKSCAAILMNAAKEVLICFIFLYPHKDREIFQPYTRCIIYGRAGRRRQLYRLDW